MSTEILGNHADFQITEESTVIEVLGEYNSYLMDLMKVLDTNCARIVRHNGNYFVITFGRVDGRDYQDPSVGPFATLEEAREQATTLLEDFEG